MQYRTLLEAEMLAFHINSTYPRIWNMPQTWQCEVEVYKATYHFIFAQKSFFTDLIQDWSSDSAPDIYAFVPYTWNFKIMFHQFEMIWAANQHNWIDCSTKQQENVYVAACGETLNIDFSLPFDDFVPSMCSTTFSLRKADEQLKQSLSEMEGTMLSGLRPSQKKSPLASSRPPIDPSELPPDRLRVELELSPDSHIILYGPLLKAFLSIKENYFGEDDMYTDFEEVIASPVLSMSTSSSSGWTAVGVDADKKESEMSGRQAHPLTLRPWDITVLVNVYKVHGRLPVHCSSDGPECPTVFLERLCFEMKKGYKETMLQLVLSPVNLFLNDNYQRARDSAMMDSVASGLASPSP
ncbi:UNVERIFIED_CONTAM: hypothetical protein K2H54_038600 [Gekko kuhli]